MFNHITDTDYQSLKDTISWITVLIAGADGNIDTNEVEWASKLTNIRAYSYAEELKAYYGELGESFEDDLQKLIEYLPKETSERNRLLADRLDKINLILAKMDNSVAYKLYESYLSFAEHVAKASGGFLRFASISKEEKSLIHLPMLNPIELEIVEEDEEDFSDPL